VRVQYNRSPLPCPRPLHSVTVDLTHARRKMVANACLVLALILVQTTETLSTKAFYVLFSDQVESSTWPGKLCQNNGIGPQGTECVDARQYKNGIFIASPQNMTKHLIAKVKQDVPGAKVLAYWDFGDIPLSHSEECPFCKGHIMGDRPGRNCSTTYHCGPSSFLTSLHEVFPNKLAVHDITDGLPGVMLESYPGLAKYIWTSKSAQLLAEFLSKWITDHGFDGMYFDGYITPASIDFHQCKTKEEGCTSFMKPNRTYDIDGDGIPDPSNVISSSYFGWGPAFVAMMRSKLGSSAIMLANSAGSLSDPSLNGLTIEMEACRGGGGGAKCANALNSQKMVTALSSEKDPVSVLWLTHSNSIPVAEQCKLLRVLQKEYPWVQAGTDYFDGSHVTC
jgi:hypothetical protein